MIALAALARLAAEATPGPWYVSEDEDGERAVSSDERVNRSAALAIKSWWYTGLSERDAAYIAALPPEVVAALVAVAQAALDSGHHVPNPNSTCGICVALVPFAASGDSA